MTPPGSSVIAGSVVGPAVCGREHALCGFREHRLEIRLGIGLDRPAKERRCVVHEDVDAAERGDRLGHDALRLFDGAHVRDAEPCDAAGLRDLVERRAAVLLGARCDQDLRAFRREYARDAAADALSAARDDRDLVLDSAHVFSPP
jgi:hypothetical protein